MESWLDGVLICKYIILSFRNFALKYNTSRRRFIVHFLMCISISSLGLETTNKEIYTMVSYLKETASFICPVKCPIFKIVFKVLLVFFSPHGLWHDLRARGPFLERPAKLSGPVSHPVNPRRLIGCFSKLPLFSISLILPVTCPVIYRRS